MKVDRVGWVVVYRNRPAYPGLDAFLQVTGPGTTAVVYSLETATVFTEEAAAEAYRAIRPTVGDANYPGRAAAVEQVTNRRLASPPPADADLGDADLLTAVYRDRSRDVR